MYKEIYFVVLFFISSYCRVTTIDDRSSDDLLSHLFSKDLKVSITGEGKGLGDKFDNNQINVHVSVKTIPPPQDACVEITDNTIDSVKTVSCTPANKVDNGTALILTPYIEGGRTKEARRACKVTPDLFSGVESYSGFFTVNKTYNSNMFFWYFPVFGKPVNETPWIIWLQGGPGASSLTGVFDEIGPFKVVHNSTLKSNPYTWLQNHSIVFIDNPVGTGYSFTESPDGYTQDMATYSSHLYSVLKQFLEIFPELRTAPLFIAGESYAGKYVPALGMEIHKHKNSPDSDINFEGLIIGNPYVDPAMISNVTNAFYYFGLLEKQQIDILSPLVESFQQDIAANRSVEAKNKWTNLITVLLLLTHQKHAYNFLRDDLSLGKYNDFLKKSEVKRALHVGDIHFSFVNITVNTRMAPDFLSSTKPLLETLLDHYKVLAYCGQLDQMLPCAVSSEIYRSWRWNSSTEFHEATRFPYIFKNRLAGYQKSGGRLTEVVMRGAGHMVPVDVPGPAQDIVARWTHGQPLGKRFSLLEGSFIQDFVRNKSLLYYL